MQKIWAEWLITTRSIASGNNDNAWLCTLPLCSWALIQDFAALIHNSAAVIMRYHSHFSMCNTPITMNGSLSCESHTRSVADKHSDSCRYVKNLLPTYRVSKKYTRNENIFWYYTLQKKMDKNKRIKVTITCILES